MESERKYPCPICGAKDQLSLPSGSYDICTVCGWEDDDIQRDYPDETGANSYWTFRGAKKAWREGRTLFAKFPNPNAVPFDAANCTLQLGIPVSDERFTVYKAELEKLNGNLFNKISAELIPPIGKSFFKVNVLHSDLGYTVVFHKRDRDIKQKELFEFDIEYRKTFASLEDVVPLIEDAMKRKKLPDLAMWELSKYTADEYDKIQADMLAAPNAPEPEIADDPSSSEDIPTNAWVSRLCLPLRENQFSAVEAILRSLQRNYWEYTIVEFCKPLNGATFIQASYGGSSVGMPVSFNNDGASITHVDETKSVFTLEIHFENPTADGRSARQSQYRTVTETFDEMAEIFRNVLCGCGLPDLTKWDDISYLL